MEIKADFDCTQRELVQDIARLIYRSHGGTLPEELMYLWKSQHPTERSVLAVAEEIFELFYGDSPDYSDEEEIPPQPSRQLPCLQLPQVGGVGGEIVLENYDFIDSCQSWVDAGEIDE